MAKLQSYDDLKNYAVRRLTGGITNLELSDDAINDGIDDAFQLFFEFHYNGYEELYLPIQLHADDQRNRYLDLNNIRVSGSDFWTPESGMTETTFETSLTSADLTTHHFNAGTNMVDYTNIRVQRVIRDDQNVLTSFIDLTPNELTNGYTLTKNADPDPNFTITLTEAVDDNDQIRLTETHFSGFTNIVGISDVYAGTFPDYYLRFSGGVKLGFATFLDEVINRSYGNIAYYHYTRQYLDLIDDYFTTKYNYSHNVVNNRLYIHQDLTVDEVLVVKAYRQIAGLEDVQTLTTGSNILDMYNDRWMKAMATAQVKQRWGWWHKYDNVELPGGKAVNGQVIYDEATQEIDKLREELELTYQDPIDFFVG